MIFNIEKPTVEEVYDGNVPIYDISVKSWNPQQYYDDKMAILENQNYSDGGKIRLFNTNTQDKEDSQTNGNNNIMPYHFDDDSSVESTESMPSLVERNGKSIWYDDSSTDDDSIA